MDVDVVHRFYAAVAARAVEAASHCFTPGATWQLPGNSVISGTHVGWPAIRDDFLVKLGPLSGGTFRADLLDVAVGDTYVVAIQHATGDHEGRKLDITGCQLITLAEHDGTWLIDTVRGHYSDQAQLDSFWG